MSDLDRLESLMTSLADIVDDDEDQREFERGLARRMPEESADWLMFLSGACTGVAVTATDPESIIWTHTAEQVDEFNRWTPTDEP